MPEFVSAFLKTFKSDTGNTQTLERDTATWTPGTSFPLAPKLQVVQWRPWLTTDTVLELRTLLVHVSLRDFQHSVHPSLTPQLRKQQFLTTCTSDSLPWHRLLRSLVYDSNILFLKWSMFRGFFLICQMSPPWKSLSSYSVKSSPTHFELRFRVLSEQLLKIFLFVYEDKAQCERYKATDIWLRVLSKINKYRDGSQFCILLKRYFKEFFC